MSEQVAVRAYWLGTIPYREAWDLQRAVVAAVLSGCHPHSLLLLEHPHVFTIGRRGDGSTLVWSEVDCRRRNIEVVWTDRGGDATYHGPGQLVGYPIADLLQLGIDVHQFLRTLEASIVSYLRVLGIESAPGGEGLTGVWSAGGKVGAIGIKLHNKQVTSHGFSLNLTADLEIFNGGIVPCGLVGRRATSVLELGGPALSVASAASSYVGHFGRAFGVSVEWHDPGELLALPRQPGAASPDLPVAGSL